MESPVGTLVVSSDSSPRWVGAGYKQKGPNSQFLMWNFKKNSIFVLHIEPGRSSTKRMSVSLLNMPQVSVLSTFLFLKKKKLLIQIIQKFYSPYMECYLKSLFSMIFIFFCNNENLMFWSFMYITSLYFNLILYCEDI